METHAALLQLIEEHKLSDDSARRLLALADLEDEDAEPADLDRIIPFGLAVLPATMGYHHAWARC